MSATLIQLEKKAYHTPWQKGGVLRTPERYTLTRAENLPDVFSMGISKKVDHASTVAFTRTLLRQGGYRLYIDGADNKVKFTNGIVIAATSAALTWAAGDSIHAYCGRYADGKIKVGAKVNAGAVVVGEETAAAVASGLLMYNGGRGIILNNDGVDDLTTLTDAAAIQNIWDSAGTIEAVIIPKSDGEGSEGRIYDKAKHYLYIYDESAGTAKLGFWVDFDGAADGLWVTDNRVITLNTLNTIQVKYDADAVANNPVITVDGSVAAITESTTPVGTRVTDAGSNLIIGNRAATDRTFDGGIGDFRMWSIARADNTDRFQRLLGTEASLTNYLPMDEATGTTATNLVSGAPNGTITGASWASIESCEGILYNLSYKEGSDVLTPTEALA